MIGGFDFDYDDLPRTVPAWMALEHARLMLRHLAAATHWPENAIYCHSCITALRSFTFLLQKEYTRDPGFADWYEGVQARLKADPEFVYLRDARNYVLKEGALLIRSAQEETSEVDLWLAPAKGKGLAHPPQRELKQMLAAKIQVLDQILEEAEEKFPGVDEEWDPEFERLIDEAD
jgi:hypothetical protein